MTETLKRLLETVPAEYDTSEGSFFYDIYAPISIELDKLSTDNEKVLNDSFVATATNDNLTLRCMEIGINRKSATSAVGSVLITGTIGTVVPIGSLFGTETINFATTEEITVDNTSTVRVECTIAGAIGNVPVQAISRVPVSIVGVSSVTNLEPTIDGNDMESDEELRERYFEKVNETATSGNASHYKEWAKSVAGIGAARVIPLASGPGTVSVIVANDENQPVSTELITDVENYIETVRPIGADVTVSSVVNKEISVSADIILQNSTIEEVTILLYGLIREYFAESALNYDYISINRIGSILFDTNSIADYSNLRINGASSNINLAIDEIPNLLEVNLNAI